MQVEMLAPQGAQVYSPGMKFTHLVGPSLLIWALLVIPWIFAR